MKTPVPADLPPVLEKMGLQIGRVTGDEIWALCPAHERRVGKPDSKPTNFSVNRVTGDAYCFACGFRSNLEGLVRETMGLNTWEALNWLQENGASLGDFVKRLDEYSKPNYERSGYEDSSYQKEDDPDLEFVLLSRPPKEALEEKNISEEAVEVYKIRWKERSWILPFTDITGRVHGWQVKRKSYVSNYPKQVVKKSNYLFGAHTVIYGQRVYVVESPLDAARLRTAGYTGGLATFGAYASKQQISLLCRLTDDVVIVMDNDKPGWAAARWLLSSLQNRMRRLHVATYEDIPSAKDPGDLTDLGIDVLLENTKSSLLLKESA